MKNVLVTGGAGFIGSEVVKKLLKKNYSVTIVDNLSKKGHFPNKQVKFLKIDLTNKSATKKAFKNIDICINLAAKIGGIGYFHKYPATILKDNNDIYSSTFSAAAEEGIKRMIFISSSMVYESANKFPSFENDITKIPPPHSAYGFSKLVGEYYCKAYFDQFKLPYTICRPFNAYGINEFPGDFVGYAHVIPDLLKKIFDGQYPLEILGSGEQIRCFTHVSDLADGIIAVMESKKAINKAYNIANSQPVTINQLAELLWKLSGQSKPFKTLHKKNFVFDVQKRIPDSKLLQKDTNWKPRVKLEQGLVEVIDWYKKVYEA